MSLETRASIIQRLAKLALQETASHPKWDDQDIHSPKHEGIEATTQRAIDVYLMSKQPNGEMGGIGWWQSANGYTAIALHDLRSGTDHNCETVSKALRNCESHQTDFINEFNDDTLWWALCCIHIYSINQEQWFLEKAKKVWHHVEKSVCRKGQAHFQGMDMEGACYWTTKPNEDQINAITTGLFAELSLRLAMIAADKPKSHTHLSKLLGNHEVTRHEYVEAARRSVDWIFRCRYRSDEAVVLDNIRLKKQEAFDWTWSYNTGVTIGACALAYELLREEYFMILACYMAQKSMQRREWIEENGVLTEPNAFSKDKHDPLNNCDGVGFKSVLMRQLITLHDVISRTKCDSPLALNCKKTIWTFVKINFDSQLKRNSNSNGQYGPWWNGPFDTPTSHSQMAALDVMAAIQSVQP